MRQLQPGKKWCWRCHGLGKVEYCVNPDNGFLDTQMKNLRYEKFDCSVCKGSGQVDKDKDTV